ncbi:lytic transglycosylase domain-containing protein [Fodinicola acaciae]|uniref:aggregation-promoting factor C-terminal-like domain-containing protein n=1 Tax=Fodinicola acaciae TaxID=2681555 RepID=UPI0013D874C3|nr:lytic transglycosylase domain-containing protein [Fodinicola acaciae]
MIRGSSLAVRAFAVAVLVIGVGAAYYATSNKDTRTIAVEQRTPVYDDRVDQPNTLADAKRAGSTAQIGAQQQKAAAAAKAAADRAAAAARAARSQSRDDGTSGAGLDVPTTPIDCMQYSGNRRIGCSFLPKFGFSTAQMACLEPLWTKESGWSTHASNDAGTAWGIPQALPGSKMKSAGPNWRDDAATQITWGLRDYIKPRYGSPCKAWAHFQANNWY